MLKGLKLAVVPLYSEAQGPQFSGPMSNSAVDLSPG